MNKLIAKAHVALHSFKKDVSGAALVEYSLLIGLITVAVVAVGVMAGSLWMYKQEKRRAAEQAAAYRDG